MQYLIAYVPQFTGRRGNMFDITDLVMNKAAFIVHWLEPNDVIAGKIAPLRYYNLTIRACYDIVVKLVNSVD